MLGETERKSEKKEGSKEIGEGKKRILHGKRVKYRGSGKNEGKRGVEKRGSKRKKDERKSGNRELIGNTVG